MARCSILTTILIIGCTTGVYSQFYDLFQALQPLVQYSTLTDHPFQFTQTTKRPRTTIKHKTELTSKNTSSRRNPAAISAIEGPSRDDSRSREKITTPKPVRKASNPQTHPKGNSRNTAREIATHNTNRNPSRIVFQDSISNANNYYDTSNGKGSKVVYTTQNPFFNRPGVKPAPVDDRKPPITNKPQTISPEVYPDGSISPELVVGPDEESMSDAEKRRYIELAERMCDKYKNLNTKQLQAIPLVPSPEPVQINITSCVPSNVPLVVGGKVVSIREFPHMALLGWLKLHSSGYAWRCGGSLISSQYVLTAAHCAYDDRDNSIVRGAPRVVQLGSSYLDDPGALVMKVASVVRHPKYVQPKSYYDVALIKLAAAVTFSEVIRPACLGVPPPPGESVIATGWGRTEFGGDLSNELRSVSIPVWNDNECAQILGTSRRLPSGQSPDSQICAGERKGGKDTCQGDSGGPAQIQDGCVWRIVAITSLGRACGAPDTPALYAKVQRAFVSSVAFGKLISNDNIRYTTERTNEVNANRRNTNRQTEKGNFNNGNRNTDRQIAENVAFVNGARIVNDGGGNQRNRQTTQKVINNGGRETSGISSNRQTERTSYDNSRDNGRNENKQTTQRAIYNNDQVLSYGSSNRNVGTNRHTNDMTNNRGHNSGITNKQTTNRGIDSAYSNHRQISERDIGNNQWNSNHRQTNSNNRAIDNENHRQENERDIYNNGGIINSDTNYSNQRNPNRRTDANIYYEGNNNWNTNQQNNIQRDQNYNTDYTQNNNYGSLYNNQYYNNQPIWT